MTDLNNERDCTSRHVGCHRMVALTIAAVMLGALVLGAGSVVIAQDSSAIAGGAAPVLKVDTGDTAWVLMSSALVLAMTMPDAAVTSVKRGF
ncbi:MAG: hypothetical protein AAB271_09585, partial [Nitrospirota bacterium]